MTRPESLLLDTHVWIWTLEGSTDRLRPQVVERIEGAARDGALYVHPLSIWEIGTLVRRDRLTLSGPVERWVEEALEVPGLSLVPLSGAAALSAAKLPDSFPGDPVDRLLVASAYHLGATLVTCDRQILDFEGTEVPERLNACR